MNGVYYLKSAHTKEGRPKIIFGREDGKSDVEITILDSGALAMREYRIETLPPILSADGKMRIDFETGTIEIR
ncbi:hypothetical protein HMSP1_46 [Sinorhizobium phage HMSP1-Susan]|nr:hypothetical protein HMSP1_46 [Sinorhizobium phage HMSP1-Susan]